MPHRTVRRKYIGRLADALSNDLENCGEREGNSRREIGASYTSVTDNTRRNLVTCRSLSRKLAPAGGMPSPRGAA
jgi:hypothetical protein